MEKTFSLKDMLVELENGSILSEYLAKKYGLAVFQIKEDKYSKSDWLLIDEFFLKLLHISGGMYYYDEINSTAKIFQDGIKARFSCGLHGDLNGLKLNKITQELPEDFLREFRQSYSIKNNLILLK